MRFWDSSAIIPLLVQEPRSAAMRALLRADQAMVVWWGSRVECASALSRLEREGRLTRLGMQSASGRMEQIAAEWTEVSPMERVREGALRLLRVHVLRAADALQLAAAVELADRDPREVGFVTLDDRLGEAASREGFEVFRD